MHPQFSQLTPSWFKRAFVYTGSIGEFRYRFARDKGGDTLHVAVYSRFCYEVATDVHRRDFPWNEDGVTALQQWLQAAYETYTATGAIPVPAEDA